jgi:hypothetical protein
MPRRQLHFDEPPRRPAHTYTLHPLLAHGLMILTGIALGLLLLLVILHLLQAVLQQGALLIALPLARLSLLGLVVATMAAAAAQTLALPHAARVMAATLGPGLRMCIAATRKRAKAAALSLRDLAMAAVAWLGAWAQEWGPRLWSWMHDANKAIAAVGSACMWAVYLHYLHHRYILAQLEAQLKRQAREAAKADPRRFYESNECLTMPFNATAAYRRATQALRDRVKPRKSHRAVRSDSSFAPLQEWVHDVCEQARASFGRGIFRYLGVEFASDRGRSEGAR